MHCNSETGKCRHQPKCKHACALRVQPVFNRPPTPVGYSDTDWIKLLQDAKRAGWDECMSAWADHMQRVAKAIADSAQHH